MAESLDEVCQNRNRPRHHHSAALVGKAEGKQRSRGFGAHGQETQAAIFRSEPHARLHYPNVRLYEGSWKEYVWLDGKSLPSETGGKAAGAK